MSLTTVASQFVELCRQGKNFDVMRTMYAPTAVSVEADVTRCPECYTPLIAPTDTNVSPIPSSNTRLVV